jgi:hypothetical protein
VGVTEVRACIRLSLEVIAHLKPAAIAGKRAWTLRCVNSAHFQQLECLKPSASWTSSQFQRICRSHHMDEAKRQQLALQYQAMEAIAAETPSGRIHVL